MWEAAPDTLAGISVASDPKLGISPVLESINTALNKYVPKEWGVESHLKVSNLTTRYKRLVEIGEATHMVLMEKNRRQVFDAVIGFLNERFEPAV